MNRQHSETECPSAAPENPVSRAGHNRLDELLGFVELGMAREAIAVACQILCGSKVNEREFSHAVSALQTHGDRLENHKPLIEAAYARLSERSKKFVRSDMLGFYHTLEDWESAYHFIPVRSKNPADLMFAMYTLLNLRKLSEAKRIQRMCLRMLRHPLDSFQKSSLFAALGGYHAQRAELDIADDYFGKMTEDEILGPSGWRGILEIQALRGLIHVWAGQIQFQNVKHDGNVEDAISLPGNRDRIFADANRDLACCEEAFYKILPKDQLWRYGWSGD